MNRSTEDLIVAITTIFLVFAIVLLLRWLIKYLEKRLDKPGWLHEKWKEITSRIKDWVIMIIGIWILISIAFVFVEKMETYTTAHQQRLDFLNTNCKLIDQGYEILNNGKSTYKCPNGKEYKE